MAKPVIMPRQGQSVETCIITRWLKKKGDVIKSGDILFSYETDKASFDAEAESDGILLDIFFEEGDEVPVLTNVAVIGNPGETTESFRAAVPLEKTAEVGPVKTSETPSPVIVREGDQPMRISPRARIMAAKMGVNINLIRGTGPNGRIIARDIGAFEKKTETISGSGSQPSSISGEPEYQEIKLSHVRKLIAKAMHESISSSAQLTHHLSADVRKLLFLRSKIKDDMEKGKGPDITLNDMICYAVIRALEKHPEVNCHFMGDFIRNFMAIHLGIAVDTSRGLMVPALKNAGRFSLGDLSMQLKELASRCKKGNVNPELLSGSAATFTVSNLGSYGVEMFTPIINLPQVAILGVNTILYRPEDLGNGIFGFVPTIGLSLTYDHRAIDGGPATLFLSEIKKQIENFDASPLQSIP